MNNYSIFFTFEDQVLQLPHNPETMPVELGGENQQYNVLGIGPITVPRTPKQKRIQIESYFPHDYEIAPETYIKFFQDAMYEQRILVYTPVRAYEDGTPYTGGDDGFQCLVENFTTEERGGETGDFYYSLEIVEYRDYAPTIIEVRPVDVGYAVSTQRTRVSDGIQVGDTVTVNGNVLNYPTNPNPVAVANNTKAVVKRKDDGYLTLQRIDDVATFQLSDDSPRKYVPLKKSYAEYDFSDVLNNSLVKQTGVVTTDQAIKTSLATTYNAGTGNAEYVSLEPVTDGILGNLFGKIAAKLKKLGG